MTFDVSASSEIATSRITFHAEGSERHGALSIAVDFNFGVIDGGDRVDSVRDKAGMFAVGEFGAGSPGNEKDGGVNSEGI